MTRIKQSPCLRCRRVPEPEKCDNKECALWRHWFVGSWDQLRGIIMPQATPPVKKDPCRSCLIPEGVCASPCADRLEWEAGL